MASKYTDHVQQLLGSAYRTLLSDEDTFMTKDEYGAAVASLIAKGILVPAEEAREMERQRKKDAFTLAWSIFASLSGTVLIGWLILAELVRWLS